MKLGGIKLNIGSCQSRFFCLFIYLSSSYLFIYRVLKVPWHCTGLILTLCTDINALLVIKLSLYKARSLSPVVFAQTKVDLFVELYQYS